MTDYRNQYWRCECCGVQGTGWEKELAEHLKTCEKATKKAERFGEWISVKERLPEKWGSYLAWVINHRIEIAVFSSEWCLDNTDGAGLEGDITHWMPLPEPPKEGE